MSTTYNDLVSNIKAWCGRTDSQTINAIPQFIAAAQTDLDATLRIAEMITTTTASGISIPMTMLKIDTVLIGGVEGRMMPISFVMEARKAAQKELIAYAVMGNSLELVAESDVSVIGYQKPPRITSANQTNAYTEGSENALLWLSLYYCAMFAKDEAAGGWQSMAADEVGNLNAAHEAYQIAGGITDYDYQGL